MLVFIPAAQSQEINMLIKQFCLEAFNKEIVKNKEEVDLRIGDFTCDCFVRRVINNDSLEIARQACKEEASKRFSI